MIRAAKLVLVLSLTAFSIGAAAADMKAAVVTGGKLALKEQPMPAPAAGEVRINVRAAGVNPVDYKRYGDREGAIPGNDASGIIDAVGAGVSGWQRGDEVLAMAAGGTYAQYVVATSDRLAKKPKRLSWEEAAALPVVSETAYRSIVEVAALQRGQRILIHGGAGGVGSAAIQIAKSRGAHVIATASLRNHDYLRSIGADEVIDYNTEKFEGKVKDVDAVLNTVNLETGARSLTPGVIKPNGILVTVVESNTAEQCKAANVRCGRPDRSFGPSIGDLLGQVIDLIEAGKYRLNIQQTFDLADAQQAWDLGKQQHTRGKLVIRVPQ